MQLASSLALACAVVAASAAGLAKIRVLMCLGVVLFCLACVGTRLPWVLGEATAAVEKKFGPPEVYSKSDRAADALCADVLVFLFGDVEKGEVPSAEPAGDEAGEVADLLRVLTERADDKAGHAPRVASVNLCPGGSSFVRGRAEFRVEFRGCLVVVHVLIS